MNIHFSRGEFLSDANSDGFLHLIRRTYWCFAPRGWWTEESGSHVVFDRAYRPICRVRAGRVVEIVEPDTWIEHIAEHLLHKDTPRYCAEARRVAAGVIARLGIHDEIKRRHKIGRLPSATPPVGWRPHRKSR